MWQMYGEEDYSDMHKGHGEHEYGSETGQGTIRGKNKPVDIKAGFKKYVESKFLPPFSVVSHPMSYTRDLCYCVKTPFKKAYGIVASPNEYDAKHWIEKRHLDDAIGSFHGYYSDSSDIEEIARKILLSSLRSENWQRIRDDFYEKSDIFIWEQYLGALDSDEVKAKLLATERERLRKFYMEKLEEPTCAKIKTDLQMLDKYIQDKEEQENSSLTSRLKKLSGSLSEAKKVLPDEKKLMLVQKVARQRLTEELRKG